MSHTHTYKTSIKKLPETSEVEIKSEISAAEFGEAIRETLSSIRKDLSLPGFRKGAVPEKMVREKVGEAALMSEAAERAISHAYGHILEAEKIDAIGQPKVSITKIAEGNPLEFTIKAAVIPEVKSLDYKKVAVKENSKKVEDVVVTDEDMTKAISDIQTNYAKANATKGAAVSEKALELTDDLVKTWGEFTNVADFKTKLKDSLKQEKTQRAIEKKRLELIEVITSNIVVAIPEILVEGELDRMSEQMKHDIERMGLKFEDYLKHIKKTEEDLKKEWRADALKRVKLDLAMIYIAKEEKISADAAKVEQEVKHAAEHHKEIDLDRARSYFSHIFQNQAVFEFLEKQK